MLRITDSLYGVVSPGWGETDVLPIACQSFAPVYRASKNFTVTVPGSGPAPALPPAPATKPWPEVAPPASLQHGIVTILNGSLPLAVDGIPYGASLQATYAGDFPLTRSNPYTWSMTGKLPVGLRLNKNTGLLLGTPKSTDAGTYTFTVTAEAKVGGSPRHPLATVTGSAVLSITVLRSSSSGIVRTHASKGHKARR